MALIDHGANGRNRVNALNLDMNYLKATPSNCLPLNPIQDELIKRTDKVLNYLQNLTKVFQTIRSNIINQNGDINKENSYQTTSQNSFSFDKLSPFLKNNNGSSPQTITKQVTETIDACNEFLKMYCPKNSFEVCLDLYSLQEVSLNMRSPVAFRETSELKSPTLDFSKRTDNFQARSNIKSKTQYQIKLNGCSTSPSHRLKPPSIRGNLFSNLVDSSPAGRLFDDISPIGCLRNTETFTNNYYKLVNPIRRISEFNCETDDIEEITSIKEDLPIKLEACSDLVNETDHRLKSNINIAKSEKEMSTEFSIEIEEVKVEVQNPHLDENGNEILLFGLNHDE